MSLGTELQSYRFVSRVFLGSCFGVGVAAGDAAVFESSKVESPQLIADEQCTPDSQLLALTDWTRGGKREVGHVTGWRYLPIVTVHNDAHSRCQVL